MTAVLADEGLDIVDGKVNGPGTGNETPVTPEILNAEKDVKEKKLILENLRKKENADTEEGKKAILEAQQELDATKEILKGITNAAIAIAQAQAKKQKESNPNDNLQEQANILTEKYYDMLDAQMKAAADQAKNLEELKNMKEDKSEVEQAIFLLKFVVGILGQVVTTFMNLRTFWGLLADDCKKVARLKENLMTYGSGLVDPDTSPAMYKMKKHMLNKSVVKGGRSWAVIGRVSILAYDAIIDAKKTVDDVMVSLPKDTVSKDALDALISKMEPRIQLEAAKHKGRPPKEIEN